MIYERNGRDLSGQVTQVLAALAAIVPMFALTIWMYLIREEAPGIAEFFLGPLLVGGGMIFWLLLLHLVICRDELESLGFRRDGFSRDLLIGSAMGLAFLSLKFLEQPVLNELFTPRPPSDEIVLLLRTVSADPVLLALWLGPVVWVGVAGFEELWRVFVLRRFWNVVSGPVGDWGVLLAVSALIGLAHAYQGPAAIVSIGMKSVIMGWYFKHAGRIRPLIVAHAVYDSIQVVMAVVSIRGY